ncbi:hypothetical protein IMZ08_15425 [Bacillus luteolus]|uniref:Uncharacterized protein n=1 Tax=Litchfieldia luteola TaxID=682179 RepID=A0ABR9QLR2_9BACI|nr:hypothetical protein [Cytobacillus luteolus]MBE4909442.1 hypothetical protein [Cytobacillus luteolus]MBP1940842.1 hypothetical protein [Cytobacillus luteolus]
MNGSITKDKIVNENITNDIEKKLSSILDVAKELIGTRTLFISRTGNHMFSVLKVLNQNGSTIEDGTTLTLEHSV